MNRADHGQRMFWGITAGNRADRKAEQRDITE